MRTKAIKICNWCKKEYTTKSPGRSKFCGQKCFGESTRKPDRYKACEICGKKFYLHFPTSKYCSKECRLKGGWNKKDSSKKSMFICEVCSIEFEAWTYRNPTCCSKKCAATKGGNLGGRPLKPGYRVIKNCKCCGKPYKTDQGQIKHRGSSCCSRDCQYTMMSIERRGKNNPNWTGGTADLDAYGPNWNKQKRKAKKRDNHTCQIQACGYKSGGDRYLDVHHINPVKTFNGNWKLANQLYNLISLCRSCHVKVEKKKIPCPVPKGEMAFDLY